MEQIEFADGFDTPDRLALGLGAGQLLIVVAGAVAAYALIRGPLPGVIAGPAAFCVAAVAAGLGWLRIGDRPALDWAVFGALWCLRPHRGIVRLPAASMEVPPAVASAAHPFRANAAQPPARDQEPAPVIPLFRPATRARRLTFFSLRGGTGRSTLATEIACRLAASEEAGGYRFQVALLDLDLRSASVSVRLGIPERSLLDFALASPEERRLVDYMATHGSGVRVLLGASAQVSPDWPVTPALLREMLRELDMEGFQVAVLDISPELTPLSLVALRACDDILIVVTPTAGGVHDAYRTTEALRRIGLRDRLRYVVNRARSGVDISETMGDLGGEVIAEIPEDGAVIEAENVHRPIAPDAPGPAADAMRTLAGRLIDELRAPRPA